MAICRIVNDELENETQLFIDGVFQAGWKLFDLEESSQGKLETMLEVAYNAGKKARSEEIKKLLNS